MTPTVKFDLASLMRKHGVTIRDLAARTGLTMKRVRRIRATPSVPYMTYCDMTQAVTGVNVFSLARLDAITKQAAAGNDAP
jgi:hypothetical protein